MGNTMQQERRTGHGSSLKNVFTRGRGRGRFDFQLKSTVGSRQRPEKSRQNPNTKTRTQTKKNQKKKIHPNVNPSQGKCRIFRSLKRRKAYEGGGGGKSLRKNEPSPGEIRQFLSTYLQTPKKATREGLGQGKQKSPY